MSEQATVTVQGKPATVDANPPNIFQGPAQVAGGTTDVEVKATDPSGNVRTNTYRVTASGATITYVYDPNGNLSSKTEGGTTTTYEWDAENRLTAVKQGPSTLASFVYDGQGRRVQKISGGVTRTYVYEGQNIVEERFSTGPTLRHVQGPGVDRPLATQDGSGAVLYYLSDHLGSIIQTTDTAGTVTLSREYDAYGNLLMGSSVAGYSFTGREWDPEIGQYYYRARYYDPKIGVFTSSDPAARPEDLNLYSYVGGNPIGRIDPLGLFPFIPPTPVWGEWAVPEPIPADPATQCYAEWAECNASVRWWKVPVGISCGQVCLTHASCSLAAGSPMRRSAGSCDERASVRCGPWLLALVIGVIAGCDRSIADRQPTHREPESGLPCDPMIVILDPHAKLEIANEFETYVLFAAACRSAISTSTSEQRKSTSEWITSKTVENPAELRRCEELSARTVPNAQILKRAKELLPGLSDWCWYFKSSSAGS